MREVVELFYPKLGQPSTLKHGVVFLLFLHYAKRGNVGPDFQILFTTERRRPLYPQHQDYQTQCLFIVRGNLSRL